MTHQPKEEDIQVAIDFVLKRVNAEQSMSHNLEALMREAAERIVGICYDANINPQAFSYGNLPLMARLKIDEVIEWLKEAIEDAYETLALAEAEKDRDWLFPLIWGPGDEDLTYHDRISDYCSKYRNELMLLVGAGLFLGLAKKVLTDSIGSNLRHPYKNELLADAIDAPLTYGKGRTNSMFTAIDKLTQFGISKAWMDLWGLKTTRDGAIGWVVKRGSSYPCTMCDDNCGFHSIEEGHGLPQHGRCRCYAVPIYI